MFKTILTLIRGSAAAAGEEVADRNALLILDQQMRDGAAALDRAKRWLAIGIAQDQRETAQLVALRARKTDLEARVRAALLAGDEASARGGSLRDRRPRSRLRGWRRGAGALWRGNRPPPRSRGPGADPDRRSRTWPAHRQGRRGGARVASRQD